MSGKRIQLKRGTTAQNSTFTGLDGEVTVDTTKKTLVVHDGTTVGGTVLAKDSDVALKVDKVVGKQLSTEDYTTAEKSKLADIAASANNYTHPASGVSAGIYRSVTVDTNGHVTAGTNPTTVSGYGLTDAYTKTEVNTSLALKVNNSEKGVANGVATLDGNGKVVLTQIPDSVLGQLEYMGTWNFTTMPTTTQKGQYWIANTSGNGYVVGDWAVWNGSAFDKVDNTDAVASVAGRTGNVVLTKSDVGLASVDNTADSAKNVLSATKWTTARTLSLAGDVTGSASIDGSGNVTINATVVDDSHSHIIADVDGLQTALDNKVAKVTSTDNAIVRFNGTTGEVQNSGVVIDDANILEINAVVGAPNYIRFNQLPNGGKKWRVGNTGGSAFSDFGLMNETDNINVLTVTPYGNVGIGVTPSAWAESHKAIQLPGGGSLYNNGATNGYINLASNNYYDGSNWRYINDAGASNYIQANGNHYWSTAPVGTAGTTLSLNQGMTLDSAGNLGLGTTPSAWDSIYKSFDMWGFSLFSTSTNYMSQANNAYVNSGWKYKTTDYATLHNQQNGAFSWYTAPSGTAGDPITWTNVMNLQSNGNLLLGTTTDNGVDKLQVNGSIKATNGVVRGEDFNVSNSDLNNILQAGNYRGTNMLNSPLSGLADWYYIEVMSHDNAGTWAMQRVTTYGTSSAPNRTFQRTKDGTNRTWTAWREI